MRGDVYLGASEARELVGRWRDQGHQAWGGPAMPRHHRHHHHRRPPEQEWDGYEGYQEPFQFEQPPGQAPYYARTPQHGNPVSPTGYPGGVRAPGPLVRDHRRQAWDRMGTGIPFVGVEAVMNAAGFSEPSPAAWLRELPPPDSANRQVLPMNTGTTPVPIASTAQITSRPQRVAFRPERVFVSAADIGGSGSAANWIINDITIGNRSQFAQSGALPGDMFANTSIDSFVTFETAQTAMDVVMVVTYQGGTEGGTPFFGSIIGTAAL